MSNPDFSSPTPTPARAWYKGRDFWLIGATAILAALVLFFYVERRPELSPVAHGKILATANGCFACHGTNESDRHANFRRLASGSWKAKSIPTLWENGIDRADILNEWITKGVIAKEAEDHKRLFIQMPAYAGFMKPAEIEAVSAWILAEGIRLSLSSAPAKTPPLPAAVEQIAELEPDRLLTIGDRLSRRYGCYQCHGELGQGGVENPASFKTTIPGFFGHEFRQLTKNGDRAEILHWIEQGRGREIESGVSGFLAKHFLDGQAIGMPGYRDQLNENEKNILTEYLLYLNERGPLSAKELESILKLLNDETLKKS